MATRANQIDKTLSRFLTFLSNKTYIKKIFKVTTIYIFIYWIVYIIYYIHIWCSEAAQRPHISRLLDLLDLYKSSMNTALARSFVDLGAVARSATQCACTQLLLKLLKRRAASRGLRKAFTAFGHEREK